MENIFGPYKLRSARYTKGVDNKLTLIDQEEQLLNAQYNLIAYQRDHLLSVLNLVKALGGGYLSPQCGDFP